MRGNRFNQRRSMQIDTPPATSPSAHRGPGAHVDAGDVALRRVAQDLEAAFLAEMLKHSGLGGRADGFGGGFGGGAGEAQFASFLTQEHARLLAERGGIGLAEGIFRALLARDDP
jgi:flagellar protein FlgJ